MAIAVTLLLIIKVIPIFKEIYSGFGAKLPTPTLVLLAISDFIRHYFSFAIMSVVAVTFLLNRFATTEKGRLLFDTIKLKLPVFGT